METNWSNAQTAMPKIVTLSQKRQNHARLRARTSSSRSSWLSSPNRLAQGINRLKPRSTKPRKTMTMPSVTAIAFHTGQLFWRTK